MKKKLLSNFPPVYQNKPWEYPYENNLEEGETNETSAPPNFMSQILPDDEITESINSLNLKQRKSLKSWQT